MAYPKLQFVKTLVGCNLRTQPNATAALAGGIPKDTEVLVTERVNADWNKIFWDGKVCYLTNKAAYVEQWVPAWYATAMKVLDCEDKYLGVPYKYGSDRNTDKDFDCSDLQAWGFEKGAGIDIHAQSTAQWEHDGVHVAKSDLRPGDLVFFDTNRDGIVNHVGIIAAPGLMLHTASAKYGVCYVPFGPGEYYYDTAYVGGKRIIN